MEQQQRQKIPQLNDDSRPVQRQQQPFDSQAMNLSIQPPSTRDEAVETAYYNAAPILNFVNSVASGDGHEINLRSSSHQEAAIHAQNTYGGFQHNHLMYIPGPTSPSRRKQTGVVPYSTPRNSYTIETKIKIAEQGLEKGRNIAAKENGLNPSMVGRWMRSIDTMRSSLVSLEATAEGSNSEGGHGGHGVIGVSGTKRRRLPDGISMIAGGKRRSSASLTGIMKDKGQDSDEDDGMTNEDVAQSHGSLHHGGSIPAFDTTANNMNPLSRREMEVVEALASQTQIQQSQVPVQNNQMNNVNIERSDYHQMVDGN
ncbi:hypothetical protein HDU79_000717, partial [Rhizoclosmatium sp. JEL0117]